MRERGVETCEGEDREEVISSSSYRSINLLPHLLPQLFHIYCHNLFHIYFLFIGKMSQNSLKTVSTQSVRLIVLSFFLSCHPL